MNTMNRREFIKKAAEISLIATIPSISCSKRTSSFPNIVFIFADDLGYGDVSCYNTESKIKTPNIDRLATQGVRFTDAHTSSGVCTPSRYSVLTGRYCWRSRLKKGVLGGYSGHLIEDGRMTVASLLQKYGYRTGCVGKWHLGWDWALKDGSYNRELKPVSRKININIDYSKPVKNGPTVFGFDYSFCIPASLDIPPYVYLENDRVTAPVERVAQKVTGLKFRRSGPQANDFEHEECLPILTKKAIDFIEKSSKKEPFFLYFALTAPHTPVLPTKKFQGISRAGLYGDFVVMVDDVVGQIMQTLEKNGVADNTLLIFTSDNGPERHAYPRIQEYHHYSMGKLRGVKRDLWEGGHRVPFIARWPNRIEPGRVCHEIIGTIDFMATVAAILGAKLPGNVAEDSYNILPALLGQKYARPIREAIILHSAHGEFAIRKGDWVYIDASSGDNSGEPEWFRKERGVIPHNDSGELFNLNKDLPERVNLYAKYPKKVRELKALLEKYKRKKRSAP